jgi:hypothetical protein
MTTREKADDLIARYLREVEQNLPRGQRADVTAELRGLLEDSLEERAAAAGRPPDEELAVEVLRAFGQPAEVAERYRTGPRHLIGPELFPAYRKTVEIILFALAILFLAGIALSAVFVPERIQERLGIVTLWSWVEKYAKYAFLNVALATLIFAVIEHLKHRRVGGAAAMAEVWDPLELPKIEDPDRVSAAGRVASIYIIVALFVVFNFFPQYFGLLIFGGGGVRAISVFDMGFRIPALLLNLWWFCALALNMALLRQGRWTRDLRWAEFGLGLFGGLIIYFTLTGSDFSVINAEWFAERGWERAFEAGAETQQKFSRLGRLLAVTLRIALVVVVIEAMVRLFRLLTRYRAA